MESRVVSKPSESLNSSAIGSVGTVSGRNVLPTEKDSCRADVSTIECLFDEPAVVLDLPDDRGEEVLGDGEELLRLLLEAEPLKDPQKDLLELSLLLMLIHAFFMI